MGMINSNINSFQTPKKEVNYLNSYSNTQQKNNDNLNILSNDDN